MPHCVAYILAVGLEVDHFGFDLCLPVGDSHAPVALGYGYKYGRLFSRRGKGEPPVRKGWPDADERKRTYSNSLQRRFACHCIGTSADIGKQNRDRVATPLCRWEPIPGEGRCEKLRRPRRST